jgi:plasmid segregation protein ParM
MIRFHNCVLKGKKGEDIDASSIVKNVFDVFAYELSKDIREFAKIKFMGTCDSLIFAGGGSKILFDYLSKYLSNDFICIKSNIGEYDNVVGSMYYRMYRDIKTNLEG